MKKHTITHWGKYYPKAYVSNGIIGFRIGKNAFEDSSCLLAGFSTFNEEETPAHLPTPHIAFSYKRDRLVPEIVSQSYDFSNGEFTTEAELDCDGQPVHISYTVFCSRTFPMVAIGSVKAVGEISDLLKMTVYFNTSDNKDTLSRTKCDAALPFSFDGKCHAYAIDPNAQAGIAYRIIGACVGKEYGADPQDMETTVVLNTKGEPTDILVSYVPNIMHNEPDDQAQRLVNLAVWTGVDGLRQQNRDAWAKIWESRIVIEGAEEKWQDAVDASYFYLMTSASEFSPTSVAPFGLSDPSYGGHFFWDTESFMFIPPLFCTPNIARSMLEYRSRHLEAAKNNARMHGYRGTQFPWQSGISGCEVTPAWCSSGEQHITLDIALAFDGYARVHNDDDAFVKEHVWPVMRGVCEWIESRVTKTERGYEILHVVGIDEGSEDVNNDFYTNTMAAKILRSGSEYSVLLGLGVRKKWIDIADHMIVNFFEDGVCRQYDGAAHRDGFTSLMAYFPYGYTNGMDSDKKTFECMVREGDLIAECYYPMLSGYLGIFPAWIGDREFALKTYEAGALNFFCEPFYSCTESSIRNPADRIDPTHPMTTSFITGRASLLSGLILGLTKISPWRGSYDAPVEEWLEEDIVLPKGWKKITIGRVTIRGKDYRIEAEHGAKHAVLIEL